LSLKYKNSTIYQTILLLSLVLLGIQVQAQIIDTDSISYQPNASISSNITYFAKDSIISDPNNRIIELYNEAFIKYDDFELKAGYIRFNMNSDMVFAHGILDSANNIIQEPIFIQGDKSYDSDTILFNMKSKKGKIQKVATQEGEGFLYGYDIKKMEDNSFFFKDGIYTTCEHPEPHFYIKATKLKLTNDKKVITGPANLVIAGVKTPLVLPFGYFPLQDKKSVGIVLPSYNFSNTRGYSLNGLGFYIGLSEYWDNEVRMDLYTGGSFRIENSFRYNKRYKFSGNLTFKYSTTKNLINPLSDEKNYSIRWVHKQDPKANPFGTFTANVDLTSNGFNQNNNESLYNQVKSTYTSNVNYTRALFDNRATLSITADHTMTNTGLKEVTMQLPKLSLTTQTIYPFRTEKNVLKKTLLSQINFKPRLYSNTIVNTYDSLMFTNDMFSEVNSAVKYEVPFAIPLSISNALSVTPSFSYTGILYNKKFLYNWNNVNGELEENTQNGIYHLYNYNASVLFNLTPVIYGMFNFNGEKIKALRHVVRPTLSYTYRFNLLDQNRYYQHVQVNEDGDFGYRSQYGPSSSAIYSTPGTPTSNTDHKWGSLAFGLNNNIEIKVKDNRGSEVPDSIKAKNPGEDLGPKYKKVKIFDALNFSSNYNFDVDSMKLADISIYTRTALGNNFEVTNNISYDPYANDGIRTLNKYFWEVKGQSGFVKSVRTTLNYTLSGKSKKGKTTQEKINTVDKSLLSDAELRTMSEIESNPFNYLDFDIPYTLRLGYSLNYNAKVGTESVVSQNVTFSGDLSLTDNWKVEFNSGYDITNKRFANSTFTFHRDLHCWQMSFNWVPFGTYRSYGFEIRVKASVLQDLKLNKRKTSFDNIF